MKEPAISPMGERALLLDAAPDARFSPDVQARIHALAARLAGRPGVREVVPGMNNLMVELHPDGDVDALEQALRDLWPGLDGSAPSGRRIEIPLRYDGEDLADLAARAGMTVDGVIALHLAGDYRVAAIGAMPGFGYLSGLAARLATPRRDVPRAVVPRGSVMIGGAQTAVMPVTAPSGWHVIGSTDVALFDPAARDPCLFAPGDRVRFVLEGAA